ncbi:MAG: threonine/serine dehydratase [Actinomycetota bacterium]|nr:threonine/serine dehydratase [Actinomycetota bacterium]MDQ2955641.1 threonine/serine dehydratase [Actinomycetota bacterium]
MVREPRTGILLKCENRQVTGSFKARGGLNALSALGVDRVVVGSSGNHGIATSWAGQQLGIQVTVVMSRGASAHKRGIISKFGADLIESDGGGTNARNQLVTEIAAQTGAVAVSPFDHPLVVAGQSTVGFEILEQVPDVHTIVAPVGGGGLISGIALAVQASGRNVRILGVEPVTANDTAQSLAAGHRISIDPPHSICDGVLTQSPGEFTFPLIQQLVDGMLEVTDQQVIAAMRDLAELGMTVEPTGALAFAGARGLPRSEGIVAVISGGNIEPAQFDRLLAGDVR